MVAKAIRIGQIILSINPCRLAGWDAVGNGEPISKTRRNELRPGSASPAGASSPRSIN